MVSATTTKTSHTHNPRFSTGKSEWHRASKSEVCPVCGGDHNCSISDNGTAAYCSRVSSGKQNAGGQHLHLLNAYRPPQQHQSKRADNPTAEVRPQKRKKELAPITQTLAQRQEISQTPHRRQMLAGFAEQRCIPVDSLIAVGAIASSSHVTIPEFAPDDPTKISTIMKRFLAGPSRWIGSRGRPRGVTRAVLPSADTAAVLICEGATDAAAAHAAGVTALGRSTRDADLTALAPLLTPVNEHAPMILLVENDKAKEGSGLSDAEHMTAIMNAAKARAESLAGALDRPIDSLPSNRGPLDECTDRRDRIDQIP